MRGWQRGGSNEWSKGGKQGKEQEGGSKEGGARGGEARGGEVGGGSKEVEAGVPLWRGVARRGEQEAGEL